MASHLPDILDEHQENKGLVILQMLVPCVKEAHSKFPIWSQTLCETRLQEAKRSQCCQDLPRETGGVS